MEERLVGALLLASEHLSKIAVARTTVGAISAMIEEPSLQRELLRKGSNMKTLEAEIFSVESVKVKKVLVAVDLSAHSEATATYAAEIGKCLNASLTLVYVYERVPIYDYASEYTYALVEDEREFLQKQLAQLLEKVRKVCAVSDSVILVGSPAEQIAALARIIDADLIVTASHHPTLLARLLNLDEAPHIVHRAPCPVLVYHEENTRKSNAALKSL